MLKPTKFTEFGYQLSEFENSFLLSNLSHNWENIHLIGKQILLNVFIHLIRIPK